MAAITPQVLKAQTRRHEVILLITGSCPAFAFLGSNIHSSFEPMPGLPTWRSAAPFLWWGVELSQDRRTNALMRRQ